MKSKMSSAHITFFREEKKKKEEKKNPDIFDHFLQLYHDAMSFPSSFSFVPPTEKKNNIWIKNRKIYPIIIIIWSKMAKLGLEESSEVEGFRSPKYTQMKAEHSI